MLLLIGSQGLKGAIHDGDDIAMEEEGDNINPLDIDAYWLQREVAKYPGFDDPVKAQKMAGSAVTAGLTHELTAVTAGLTHGLTAVTAGLTHELTVVNGRPYPRANGRNGRPYPRANGRNGRPYLQTSCLRSSWRGRTCGRRRTSSCCCSTTTSSNSSKCFSRTEPRSSGVHACTHARTHTRTHTARTQVHEVASVRDRG